MTKRALNYKNKECLFLYFRMINALEYMQAIEK
jgi:hypothetical protein